MLTAIRTMYCTISFLLSLLGDVNVFTRSCRRKGLQALRSNNRLNVTYDARNGPTFLYQEWVILLCFAGQPSDYFQKF